MDRPPLLYSLCALNSRHRLHARLRQRGSQDDPFRDTIKTSQERLVQPSSGHRRCHSQHLDQHIDSHCLQFHPSSHKFHNPLSLGLYNDPSHSAEHVAVGRWVPL